MKTLFRILGTAAAVAVTGAAIVVLDKILNEKDALHVEQVEFPEEAEKDAAEAEKVAEAYAEGEAKSAEPGDAWPPAFEKTPEAAAPAKEETKAEEPVAELEDEPKVVRHKTFPVRPMSVEDAVMQMELLGHDFFVFVNADTNRTNVLYQRKDGGLGLLEPEA